MPITPKLFRGAAADAGKICVIDSAGEATFVAMSGDATISNAGVISVAADATDIAITEGNILIGDASGVSSELDVSGNTKIMIGDGTTAAMYALSGDATMTNAGVVTVTDVTVGSDATGDILYKSSATALARLAKGGAGHVLVMNDAGTLPYWSKELVMAQPFTFNSAAVIASNVTPLVMLDFSALQTAGVVAAGDVLVYHGAILQVDGGTVNYDQNQNFIAKYQTAGGGAAVSLTVANLMNGAADGVMSTCKPIATDLAPEADQDIVLTSSASPKAAAGDRGLSGTIYFSVYTPV